jgi:hypothetical protein
MDVFWRRVFSSDPNENYPCFGNKRMNVAVQVSRVYSALYRTPCVVYFQLIRPNGMVRTMQICKAVTGHSGGGSNKRKHGI